VEPELKKMRRKFYTILRGNAKSLAIVPENTRIVPLQPAGEPPIFFMVDSYPFFIDVVNLMGTDHPVLSLIGQEETQISETYSIVDEAAAHVKTILGQQSHGPYVLGGCSASGIVAYEIAQQLQSIGHEVSLLVLFDTPNPHFMREYSALRMSLAALRDEVSHLRWGEIPEWMAKKTGARIGKMIDWLAPVWRRSRVGAGIKQFGPLETRINAARRYRPASYSGPLLIFKRDRQQLTGRYLDPQYGWGDVARGNFEVCPVRGADHLEIFKDETDRELIARRLRRHLGEVAGLSPGSKLLLVAPQASHGKAG
jgi:thioesterase domain-containing protein